MPLYPLNPNARANPWDEIPDWASSDFPTFENAVNSGASAYRPAALSGGEIIKTADRRQPSSLDHLGRYAVENYGASQEEAEEFKRFVLRYALRHPKDAWTLRNLDENKLGTVTRDQDTALRRSFEDRDNRLGPKARENYNAAINSGKLRVIP